MKLTIIAFIVAVAIGFGLTRFLGSSNQWRPIANEGESTPPASIVVTTPTENNVANQEEPANNQVVATTPVEEPVANESEPASAKISVYFLDTNNYKTGAEPYEKQVFRDVKEGELAEVQTLTEIFRGPNTDEQKQGLATVKSKANGFYLRISHGVAKVYLKGDCNSEGATYTIANLITKNLRQFPEIKTVKIYDPQETTEIPEGDGDSIPVCLEP